MPIPFLIFKGLEWSIEHNQEEQYWEQYKKYFSISCSELKNIRNKIFMQMKNK
jgi:hypothetical protein